MVATKALFRCDELYARRCRYLQRDFLDWKIFDLSGRLAWWKTIQSSSNKYVIKVCPHGCGHLYIHLAKRVLIILTIDCFLPFYWFCCVAWFFKICLKRQKHSWTILRQSDEILGLQWGLENRTKFTSRRLREPRFGPFRVEPCVVHFLWTATTPQEQFITANRTLQNSFKTAVNVLTVIS